MGGLVLISAGGMVAATLKTLKRKCFFGPIMLFYMKLCNYEKFKPTLIKAIYDPKVRYVQGGHLSTVLCAEKFIDEIKLFLEG